MTPLLKAVEITEYFEILLLFFTPKHGVK